MTNLNIACGVCLIQDLNTTADHRCQTCGYDVCISCDNEGYDLDHKRIDEAKIEQFGGGGCSWCGKNCPDAARPQGCWFPGCPDEPHA